MFRSGLMISALLLGAVPVLVGCDDEEECARIDTGVPGRLDGGIPRTPSTSCEAICQSTCPVLGLDPSKGFTTCVASCVSTVPDLDDKCGAEMRTYVECTATQGCDFVNVGCAVHFNDWDDCNDGAVTFVPDP